MKKNKGQALIEFILIIPFLLLMLSSIFDVANVLINKYTLQNDVEDIIVLYKKDKKITQPTNYDLMVIKEDNMLKLTAAKKVNIITPLADRLFTDPYIITIERYIYEE